MTDTPGLPDSCGVGFKEWAGVCRALSDGSQCLILRKGGISEGPGGFVPEHRAFWLYPTHVHEAEQGLRHGAQPAGSIPDGPEGATPLTTLAVAGPIARVDRLECLEALIGLHVWTEETVLKRFHYRQPGLWVLGVRVYRRDQPAWLEHRPEYAGCKTWVRFEPPLATDGAKPVLDGSEFARRMDLLQSALDHAC